MFDIMLWFFIGSCLGSFANLIVYRLPKGLSVIQPRSHCVSCKKQIPWYYNFPILSVVILRAKCAFCKKKFGWQTLIVELLMGVLFVLFTQKYAYSFSLVEVLIFVFALVTITFIDIENRIIPDVFSLSGIIIGLLGALINPDRSFYDAILGVLIGGGVFWLVAYIYYRLKGVMGLGGGDIKLLAWIGAVLGSASVMPIVLFSSISGSIFGLLMMIKTKEGLKTSIAFGPFLSLGALLYLYFGNSSTRLFYSFFFPWLD